MLNATQWAQITVTIKSNKTVRTVMEIFQAYKDASNPFSYGS